MMRTNSISRLMGCASAAALIASCGRSDLYIGFVQIDAGAGASSTTTTASGGSGGASLCVPGAMQSCYSGPAGTEGQGICRAGSQTCAPDGASFGPCVGEVLPLVEDCATAIDEDCDGMAPPCKGTLLWAKSFGDLGDEIATGVAADQTGNVLLAGYFSGVLDWGGGPLLSIGGNDVFVAKLGADGSYLWAKNYGDAADQWATSIAVDAESNTLVTGYFRGSVDFGGGALNAKGAASYSAFVAKLDQDGNHIWSKSFGDGAYAASISVDSEGSVILGGWFSSTVDFGGGLLTSAGGNDAFVAKLDVHGNHVWSKRFGDGSSQTGRAAVDPFGNVVLAGAFKGSLDFGGGALSSVGEYDLFAAKLDAKSGDQMMSATWGSVGAGIGAAGVAVDASGNIAVVGVLSGSVDVGGQMLTSTTQTDVFVAKMSPDGKHAWSRSFGATAVENAYAVDVDNHGNVLITSYFEEAANFGGGQVVSAGDADAFIAKLDAEGGYLWARRAGDAATQTGTAVTRDGAGNVVVAGYFSGSIDFGSGPLLSVSKHSVFVAKFTP